MNPPENHLNTWSPIYTLLWGILVFALFLGLQIASVWLYIGATYGELKSNEVSVVMAAIENNGTVMAYGAILPAIFSLLAIAGIIKLKGSLSIKEYLGLTGFSFATFGKWLAIVIIYLIICDSITYLLGRPIVPDVMLTTYKTAEPLWLLWFALIVAAPLFEEIFFRGFLLRGFSNCIIGPMGAIVLTSILWAVIHVQYDVFGIGIIFIMGLILGYAKYKTQSIWMPIILHAISNFIAATQTAFLI